MFVLPEKYEFTVLSSALTAATLTEKYFTHQKSAKTPLCDPPQPAITTARLFASNAQNGPLLRLLYPLRTPFRRKNLPPPSHDPTSRITYPQIYIFNARDLELRQIGPQTAPRSPRDRTQTRPLIFPILFTHTRYTQRKKNRGAPQTFTHTYHPPPTLSHVRVGTLLLECFVRYF